MSRSMKSFIAGGAFVGASTTVVVMSGAALDLWAPLPPVVVVAGVAAGAVAGWLARHDLEAIPLRVGAGVAGAAAILAEFVGTLSGLGAVQLTALLATVVAVLLGPAVLQTATSPVPGWVIGLGFVILAVVLVLAVFGGGQLGHDESAYALKARAWLDGTPATGWTIHRGIAQSLLAALILPFSHQPEALRLASVLLSLGTVVAVWALGRSMQSDRVGVAAAVIFAVAPSFLRRGAEFLTDVPSTGLLLVVTVLLWRWASSARARHALLYWAVTVAAVSFYFRYQSVLSLGLLAVATAVVAWDRVRDSRVTILRAAGLGLILLLPHFVFAVLETGVPWGVITYTAAAGGRAFLGEGLVDYARTFPDLLAGQLGAVAIVVGIAWFGWRMRPGAEWRPAVFLAVPAVGQFVLLGLVSHGEPRFVFFPVALLAVAAALAADEARTHVSPGVYRAGVATFAVAAVASLGLHGDRIDRNAEARGDSIQVLVEAADAIAAQSRGACGVVTGLEPQMTWLSGCHAAPYELSGVDISLDSDLERFLLLSENGPREPAPPLEDQYIDLAVGEPVRIESDGSIGDAEVWRLGE